MGIVNINDDSFCGDGRIDSQWAIEKARELVTQGADIVDVGGESARTNRAAITPEEEWRRLLSLFGAVRRSLEGHPAQRRSASLSPFAVDQYLAPRSSRGRTPIQRASAQRSQRPSRRAQRADLRANRRCVADYPCRGIAKDFTHPHLLPERNRRNASILPREDSPCRTGRCAARRDRSRPRNRLCQASRG